MLSSIGRKHGSLMSSNQTLPVELLFQFEEQQLVVDSLRGIYWSDQKMLIVSDLHLGKAGHFRKHGIPVPRQVHISDFQKLNSLIKKYEPDTVMFLGDLFHSEENDEWQDFVSWSNHHQAIRQILVEGNHDILCEEAYKATRVELHSELIIPPFHFTHKPTDTEFFNLAGHLHPSVKLFGNARQGMSFPCFYFGKRSGLFPAFGTFTGNYRLKPQKGDQIFALADGAIIALVG